MLPPSKRTFWVLARQSWGHDLIVPVLCPADDFHPLAADLSDSTAALKLDSDTAELDIGILVAAAGFGTSGPLLASDLAAEINMVHVNCTAVLAMTWAFGRRFARRGRGGIVLMSSLLGFHGVPYAAKADELHELPADQAKDPQGRPPARPGDDRLWHGCARTQRAIRETLAGRRSQQATALRHALQ